jgi:acetyl-CoA carboxylase biotin carboxyl carrier protein
MDLTHEDVQRILKIIDEASHLEELDLQYGDFRLHIRRHGAGERTAPPAVAVPSPRPVQKSRPEAPAAKAKAAPQSVPEGMVAIRAPMLGTFYRSPSPGEKPFVEVGQRVTPEDTVCLIEVMKLFNSIKAGVAGKIAEIRSENAALVEYNEVLIVIEPSKA